LIDPLVSLAFSVYSNKGAYVLLLGSGISRASGIPTGWEVVLDLIRKVAKLEAEDCEPDPAGWFRQRHRIEPDYSKLLDLIAKTSTERQQLLRGYFEPTEDDRGQSLKLPNAAHRAIAQLVAGGYLRVIITTNFDRLIEKALEEVGIAPTVISTTDQIAGALPLAHSGATVIKLHGDYLDTRIKNTETELAAYDVAFLHPSQWALLNFEEIYAMDWRHPNDLIAYYRHRSRKCAEVLVPHNVEPKYLNGAYVVDQAAALKLQELDFNLPVVIDPVLFFC